MVYKTKIRVREHLKQVFRDCLTHNCLSTRGSIRSALDKVIEVEGKRMEQFFLIDYNTSRNVFRCFQAFFKEKSLLLFHSKQKRLFRFFGS